MSSSIAGLELKAKFIDNGLFLVSIVFSVLVLLGWKINVLSLVQFPASAAPVQFNTALGLLFVSIIPILYLNNKPVFAHICLGAVFLIGGATLLQYLVNVELGIDELFHDHSLTTKTSHPGRMAPNSAANFILIASSISILLFERHKVLKLMVGSLLAGIVFILSLVAIVGYIFGLDAAYSLGSYTQMSLITAVCFGLISANCLYFFKLRVSEADEVRFYRAQILSFSLFFITLLISSTVEKRMANDQKNELRAYAISSQEVLNLNWRNMLVQLQNLLYKSGSQEHTVRTDSTYIFATFKKDGTDVTGYKGTSSTEKKLSSLIKTLTFDTYMIGVAGGEVKYGIANTALEDGTPIIIVRFFKPIDEAVMAAHYYAIDIEKFKSDAVEFINRHLDPQFEVRVIHSDMVQDLGTILSFPYSKFTSLTVIKRPTATLFSSEQLPLFIIILGSVITVLVAAILFFVQRLRFQSIELDEQQISLNEFKSALNETNVTLTLAAQVAELGIWRWNVNSGELTWNDRMFQIYDTPEEIIKSGLLYEYWYDSVHPDDRDRASSSLQAAVEQNESWRENFRVVWRNGEIRHVKASAMSTFDKESNSQVIVGGNLDVTNEYNLREELIEKTAQAEQHSLAKSQFLANMSHEIRTPMNAILGISDLLSSTELNSQQRKFIDLIIGSAETLMSLINDILDLSKIEAGELNIETLSFPIEEVLFDATKIMSAKAHEKRLNFYCTIDSSVPMYIESDPVRITQIAINLISNAIKFTEEGQISLQVHKCDFSNNEGEFGIELRVQDTGIGIPKDRIEEVLKPFTQSDASTTRHYGGTGLGLAIVMELTELLNGQLSIDSEVGVGTKVSVKMPIKQSNVTPDKSKVSSTFEEFANYRNKSNLFVSLNVLLLDPHELNRNWISDMLHSWGSNVDTCKDEKCLKKLIAPNKKNKRKYDVIILNNSASESFVSAAFANLDLLTSDNDEQETFVIIQIPSTMAHSEVTNKNNVQFISSPVKQSELFNLLLTRFINERSTQDSDSIEPIDASLIRNILVAEDHEVNQFYVREILEGRGHLCTIVNNGREALEAVQKQKYDLILMDVQMPIMDGITATQKIREIYSDSQLHIIGLTARALTGDVETCLEAGMNGYLTKPVLPEKLLQVIESIEMNSPEIHTENINSQITQAETDIDNMVIDLALCELATGGNTELFKKLLTIAISSSVTHVTNLEQFLRTDEWKLLLNEIHKLKGMIGNFVHGHVNNKANLLEEEVQNCIEQKRSPQEAVNEVINLTNQFKKDAKSVLANLEP